MEKVKHSFRAKFYKLNYMFDMDGSITPFIQVYPAVKVPAGSSGEVVEIEHVDTDLIDNRNNLSLSPGDMLEFNVHPADTDEGFKIHVDIITKSAEVARPVTSTICPICGAPLLPGTRGIGRCLNRSCKAQMSTSVMWMLNSFGIELNSITRRIIVTKLSSGSFDSIMDLYRLGPDILEPDGYNAYEISTFLYDIHRSRGRISLSQFLAAIRVPGWNTSIVKDLAEQMETKGYGLRDVPLLMQNSVQKYFKRVPWAGWNDLISVADNADLIARLALINVG